MTVTVTSADLGPAAAEVYRLLAVDDAVDEAHDWATAWLLRGMLAANDTAAQAAANIADVFDPAVCPANLLPWLAQFVGVPAAGLSEAELRAAIPAPEGWRRGSLPVVRLAALRRMASGAVLTIIVNSSPSTFPAESPGDWTFVAAPGDVPSQDAYEAAVTAAIYGPFRPHFVYAAGQTINALTGTINALTGSTDTL